MIRRNTLLNSGLALAAVALAGCSSFPFFGGDDNKPGPLPEFRARNSASVLWQHALGNTGPGFAPVLVGGSVFAASADGSVLSLDLESGRVNWRVSAGTALSAGAGSDGEIVVVGTAKGAVHAFDATGKALWQARVSSEILAPPRVAEGVVAVWSGDGRVFGFQAKTGERKWVYQRGTPALTLRSHASGVTHRGGLFTGSAGGKLVAMDMASGAVGWEASIATPKGATELERIADVTSTPVADDRQICAVAFQGRLACFDILRGTMVWSREISSHAGLSADARALYVTDDKGNLHALDKSTGASIWKQDKLAKRRPSAPQLAGDHLAVIDAEGYLHLLDRTDGALIGRLALDGNASVGQPAIVADGVLVLSSKGTLTRLRTQ
ncbi:MAG: outer membrane protein assembly factor BamB [Betaproteobacteria bacterium]|nr:outer membrane protein assembly factor BamB [Betaproteobacteria bacterium]